MEPLTHIYDQRQKVIFKAAMKFLESIKIIITKYPLGQDPMFITASTSKTITDLLS